MACKLAAHGPGIVSDKNEALIVLYQAVRDGWYPPKTLSKVEWESSRSLPDTDPLKAFAGFGCSVLGKWFGGYEAPRTCSYQKKGEPQRTMQVDRCAACRDSLLRDIPKLSQCDFITADFLETEPFSWQGVIYADPPYAGTTGYAATGPFDHDRFWARCAEWERHGVPVLVSEYTCPVPHDVLWSKTYGLSISAGRRVHTDKLFRVLV